MRLLLNNVLKLLSSTPTAKTNRVRRWEIQVCVATIDSRTLCNRMMIIGSTAAEAKLVSPPAKNQASKATESESVKTSKSGAGASHLPAASKTQAQKQPPSSAKPTTSAKSKRDEKPKDSSVAPLKSPRGNASSTSPSSSATPAAASKPSGTAAMVVEKKTKDRSKSEATRGRKADSAPKPRLSQTSFSPPTGSDHSRQYAIRHAKANPLIALRQVGRSITVT